ncbi:M48 family metallopeptidase [Reichenbachiella sp. 5M10]|uniref:tetratricopeptide repeat protein n=1 Tax=Reichenbachiella sp. 5M10 TaxID=1889772 RepID=UPI00117A51B9|nr:hypothetical protein [Reichenbachiella sp. 5M10]
MDFSIFFTWLSSGGIASLDFPVYSSHSTVLEGVVSGEVSLILQKAKASYELLSDFWVFGFAVLVYLALAFGLAVVSTFNRFWFVIAMGVLVLLVSLSGVSGLGLFGVGPEVVIGGLSVLLIALTYYYQSVRVDVPFIYRVLSYCTLFSLVSCVIVFSSVMPRPLLLLSYDAYWLGLIFSIAFSLLVGHEVVYAILVVATRSMKGDDSKESGIHFIVFSLIYLLNVGLLFMRNSGYINWDIYYLNPTLLLAMSALLGVWGLKDREVLYKGIMPFMPFALIMYFSLAVVCFVTILFLSFSGNDPALEVIEDAIVFGHLGFGGMFFIYVLVNFITLLLKGLPIYKVVFKEDNFPYATSKLAGLIIVSALFFASNYAAFNQAVSGYFNGLGDMNLSLGEYSKAKEYYRRGAIYGNMLAHSNRNHRSNFMYAELLEDHSERSVWYKSATQKNPTEEAFVNLGVSYESNNQFFDAIFAYQEGLKEFPDSWALRNNLAMLYLKTNVEDSVIYHMKHPNNANAWQSGVMEANLLGAYTRHDREVDFELQYLDRIDVQTNAIANKVAIQKESDIDDVLESLDLQLNLFSFAYLKNVGMSEWRGQGTYYLDHIDSFLEEPANDAYYASLVWIKALNLYERGDVAGAYGVMHVLASRVEDKVPYVEMLLGKWSMEQDAPLLAARCFERARENGYPVSTADLAQAYAQTERASVGQYLLYKEREDNSTDAVYATKLEALELALREGKDTWPREEDMFVRGKESLRKAQEVALSAPELVETMYLELGEKNPFYEPGVLAAAEYFNQERKDPDQAYGILLQAITINEFSAELLMGYIEQCLAMGLTSYAESAVVRLVDVLSPQEFEAYEVRFEEQKANAEASLNTWE